MEEMEVGAAKGTEQRKFGERQALKADELWGQIIRLNKVLMGKVLRLEDIEVTTNWVALEQQKQNQVLVVLFDLKPVHKQRIRGV